MIIVAMIIGYALGVLPFLFFYAINGYIRINKPVKEAEKPEDTTAILVDEWLNGAKQQEAKETENKQGITDIYKELVTGEVSGGTQ